MRPFLALLCGDLLGLIGLALAATPALGELRADRPVTALGPIRGGPDLAVVVKLTNAGDAPLRVLSVERGCSCLVAVMDGLALAAGESAALTLRLRTLGHKNGPYVWTARVRYQQADVVRETPLRLEGTISNEVTLEPSELSLHVADRLTKEAMLIDLRPTPFKVRAVSCELPGVEVGVKEDGRGVWRLVLQVDAARLPDAARQGTIGISTDDPAYALITLPLTVQRAQQAVRAIPDRIRLGPTAGPRSTLVRLRAAGDRQATIARIETPAGVECTHAPDGAGGFVLRIQLVDTAAIPPSSVVRVYLRDPDQELSIPIEER